MLKQVAILLCCSVFFGAVALGDAWDKQTVITTTEPILVAGVPVVTLEPGTYVMRLLNSAQNRHIVQIFNETQDKLLTTVLAIPNYNLDPHGKTVFRWWETPEGNPRALRAWFYPGDNFGQEFVYPEGLAPKIASETGRPVLATPAETVAELEVAPITVVRPSAEEQPVEDLYTAAELAPLTEPELALAAAHAAPGPIAGEAVTELPSTASPYFMLAIAGFCLIAGGALVFRAASR